MGNWLSAIGQATPAIRQTMQDIQERPKQEARWGFEQEEMGMKREQFGQTKAVNEITLNKMKYEEKQRQEKEAYLNKPWNAKMDLMLADLPEDYQEKALKMMKQTGLIDENNVGKMKSREMVTEMFKSKPEIFEWYAKGKEVKLKGIAEKAMEDYQKLNDGPGADEEKKAKARDKAVAAGEQLSVFMGAKSDILGKMKTAKEYEGLLNDIKKSDTWKILSNEEKGSLELGAIEAVKTGSTKGWDEAVKNVVKKEQDKKTTPSWKVVQDPKSSTGYSYQDMNNPTGELRTGAPAPKAAAEVKIDIGGKSFTEMGKKMGERVVEQHKDAEQAIDSLKRLQDAKKLLTSGMITGAGAGYILSVGKVLQQGGISLAPDAIANTEAYAAMMGNQVGQIIKQFGAGTGLSDADREYAEKIAGGKITLTKQSLEKIIDLNEKGLRNAVQNYNKRAKEIMDKPEGKDLPYDLRIDVPRGLMGEGMKGLIHYYVGDNEYFIPPEKESSFIKKYPNAKKAK